MLGPEDIDDLLAKGAIVLSIDGDKIGPLGQVCWIAGAMLAATVVVGFFRPVRLHPKDAMTCAS